MPNPPDPRWGYPSPTGGDDADVPADIGRLHDRMISVGATITQSAGDTPTNAVGHLHWRTAAGGVLFVGEGESSGRIYGIPIGLPLPWPVEDLPDGDWVSYNGTLYPQLQYPRLFAVLGRRYTNPSVNASLFAVPDYSGRALIGPGNGRSVGAVVGSETHLLTPAQTAIVDHEHDMSVADHGGLPPGTTQAAGKTWVRADSTNNGSNRSIAMTTSGAWSTGIGVGGVKGGGRNASQAHNIMQPSIVVNWIARAR